MTRPAFRQKLRRRFEAAKWRPIQRQSEHLVLQPLKTDDRHDLLDSIDEDVMHWQGYSAEHVQSMRTHRLRNQGHWSWPCAVVIRGRAVGEFVGGYFVENINAGGSTASLGWWLAASARGRGLGVESLNLVLDNVHHDMGIRRVIMGTAVDNVRAIAQIRRSGATVHDDAGPVTRTRDGVSSTWFEHIVETRRVHDSNW